MLYTACSSKAFYDHCSLTSERLNLIYDSFWPTHPKTTDRNIWKRCPGFTHHTPICLHINFAKKLLSQKIEQVSKNCQGANCHVCHCGNLARVSLRMTKSHSNSNFSKLRVSYLGDFSSYGIFFVPARVTVH